MIIKTKNDTVRLLACESDTNHRLINQSALLLKIPRNRSLEDYIKANFSKSIDPVFTKIKIPNEGRDDCLVTLNKMNINHMTLFPDIDGAAKHVNSLWQPGHEDSIIHF